MKNYILEGKTPVLVDNIIDWANYYGSSNRHVDNTYLEDGTHISTVFLGLDHSFGDGPPILFETMIFGGPEDEYQERYSTWEEAEEGHKKAVELAKHNSKQNES